MKVFDTDIGRIGGQICWENHIINITAWFIAQGVGIHLAVWPGMWNCGTDNKESFIHASHNINKCDLVPATGSGRSPVSASSCRLTTSSG